MRLGSARNGLLLLGCGLALQAATAQLQVSTIHVRVLRGRNGHAVALAHVAATVVPAAPYATPIERTTDAQGRLSLLLQSDAAVHAAVLHYQTCRHVPRANRRQAFPAYPIQQIVTAGIVETNGCGGLQASPTPGELTLYVRRLHWWQRLRP